MTKFAVQFGQLLPRSGSSFSSSTDPMASYLHDSYLMIKLNSKLISCSQTSLHAVSELRRMTVPLV